MKNLFFFGRSLYVRFCFSPSAVILTASASHLTGLSCFSITFQKVLINSPVWCQAENTVKDYAKTHQPAPAETGVHASQSPGPALSGTDAGLQTAFQKGVISRLWK